MDKLKLIEAIQALTEKKKVETFDKDPVFNAAIRLGYAMALKDFTDEITKG